MAITTQLARGSTGEQVKELQRILGITADGIFGPNTEKAVKDYQSSHGLSADGIVGPKTIGVMFPTITQPQNQVTPTVSQSPVQVNTQTSNVVSTPTIASPLTVSNNTNNTTVPNVSSLSNSSTNNQSVNTTPLNTSGSPDGIQHYGQTDVDSAENFARSAINMEADLGKSSAVGELTPAFVTSLKNDPNKMAFYIGAMAYGGYTLGDIYADMYASQQKQKGISVPNVSFISPTMNRNDYVVTDAGKSAIAAMDTLLPSGSRMKTINPDIFKYTIANLPDDAFVPYADRLPKPGTPEWKQKASEIKAAYYDLLTAQASAETEQQKALADNNLQQFKDDMQKNLGITLNDNSQQAWKQIQNLDSTYNTRGIQQSGLRNEDVDNTLRTARLTDSRNRDKALTETERQTQSTLLASGTSAQIAALSPEQRQKLGLTPSADVLNQFSIENIKKMDPTLTDAEAQAYRDTVIDENGNYRSTLYSNYYKSKAKNAEDKKTYQNNTLMDINLDAETKKARETSTPDANAPFDTPTNNPNATNPESTSNSTQNALQNAGNVAGNLGTGATSGSSGSTNNGSTAPTIDYDSWITSGNLKNGSKNSGVSGLQNYLGITSDGIFGNQTQQAVIDYQKRNNLTADGIVGPNTLAAIKAGKK